MKRREAAETDDLETYSEAKTPVVDDVLAHAPDMALAIGVPTDR